MVGEKLDFLMKLTDTSSATLGRVLHFDASYVSRIRSNKRGIPKKQPFLVPAAWYFAERIKEPYRRIAAAEMIYHQSSWPEQTEEAARLIERWLRDNDAHTVDTIGHFLTELSETKGGSWSMADTGTFGPEALPDVSPEGYYYGNSGKRNAVERFLTHLCALGKPQLLLLSSDEDMTWLTESRSFVKKWSTLMSQLIALGSRIQIIHTVSRNFAEMLEAVQGWMPLYMSGAIEPYYYPAIRDEVYRRTLFIAKDELAVMSNSVGTGTDRMLTLVISDRDAVRALEREYADYFELCRPLMQIYNIQNAKALSKRLSDHEHSRGSMLLAHRSPSLFTMPPEVIRSMSARSGKRWLSAKCLAEKEAMQRLFEAGGEVTELLALPAPSDVKAARIHVPLCDLFGSPELTYTEEEFCVHLSAVMEMMRTWKCYHVYLVSELPERISISSKEEVGTLIYRDAPPVTAFYITERRMNAAIEAWMRRRVPGDSADKTIMCLQDYVEPVP